LLFCFAAFVAYSVFVSSTQTEDGGRPVQASACPSIVPSQPSARKIYAPSQRVKFTIHLSVHRLTYVSEQILNAASPPVSSLLPKDSLETTMTSSHRSLFVESLLRHYKQDLYSCVRVPLAAIRPDGPHHTTTHHTHRATGQGRRRPRAVRMTDDSFRLFPGSKKEKPTPAKRDDDLCEHTSCLFCRRFVFCAWNFHQHSFRAASFPPSNQEVLTPKEAERTWNIFCRGMLATNPTQTQTL
jgi:hypothetical protein